MQDTTKESIEQALNVLVGLPLVSSNRALDLDMFDFGPCTKQAGKRARGEYALHVQCAWRITGAHKIIVTSHDRYYPGDGSSDVPDDFDWTLSGNRRDIRLKNFLQENTPQSRTVKSVEADNVGGVKLRFAGNFTLELFPDDSFSDEDSERWRFFRPSQKEAHFVVMGYGIQE